MNTTKTKLLMVVPAVLLSLGLNAQNNAMVAATFAVAGNCGMCKETIEEAASVRGVKTARWDENTKMLAVKYHEKKTSPEVVLRSVAYAGYDNEMYLAPESAYSKLKGCCQYLRVKEAGQEKGHLDHHPSVAQDKEQAQPGESGISQLYDHYFRVKDALINSNAESAAVAAKELLASVDAVKMEALKENGHDTFMKQGDHIRKYAGTLSGTKNIEKQRAAFSNLSGAMYELMKAVKPDYGVYLDHCPMYDKGKGANWISREKEIRNPYYGSKMLTCGRVIETLK